MLIKKNTNTKSIVLRSEFRELEDILRNFAVSKIKNVTQFAILASFLLPATVMFLCFFKYFWHSAYHCISINLSAVVISVDFRYTIMS